jgi:predicted transposase/invertase (TIGR01784 family)
MDNAFLSPRQDWVFKILFGTERSREYPPAFLQAALRLPPEEYEEVYIVNPHLPQEYPGGKLGILDLKLKTRSGKIIDIEIQVSPMSKLRERIVFYAAKMITEQINAGEDYKKIQQVIIILITDYTFIEKKRRLSQLLHAVQSWEGVRVYRPNRGAYAGIGKTAA